MEEVNTANKRLKLALDNHERDLKEQIAELDDLESKLNERLHELNKKKQQIAQTHGSTNISGDDLIEINAGGKIIAAKRSTLTQLDGTRLEALFSGRWEKKILRDSHGRIFLDVNPVCFQAIVDYLTEMLISSEDNLPKLLPIVDDEHKDIMKHQIELFGLFSHKQSLSNSSIIKERTHIEQLHNWLNEDGSDGELGLLYRGSRDGFTSKDFHDTCDNKGPTLTIVKTKDGYVLGGYSNTSWSIYEFPGEVRVIYKKADKAFLFLLTDSDGIHAPYKMKLNSYGGGDAICHSSGEAGPTFGSGHDLYVSLHANDPTLNLWLGKGGSYISSDIPEQLTSPGSGYKTLPRYTKYHLTRVQKSKSKRTRRTIIQSIWMISILQSLQNGNLFLALNQTYNTGKIVLMTNNPLLHHSQVGKQRIS